MQPQNTLCLFVACIILQLAMAVGPSGLTQPGAPADCILRYSAKKGDTASGIAASHNIPLATFIGGNPQLNGDPLALWEGYDYCVPQALESPPFRNSSKATGGNETALKIEESGHVGTTGLTFEEYGTTKDSNTGSQSSKGFQFTNSSQSTAVSRSTEDSRSTINSQTSTGIQSTPSSQSSTGSQSTTESQSDIGSDIPTAAPGLNSTASSAL